MRLPCPVELIEGGVFRELFDVFSGANISRRRRCAEIKPIADLRGFPTDMNQFYQDYFLSHYDYSRGYGYHSWLTAREILDFDWDGQFLIQKERVDKQYAHLFKSSSTFPKNFPKEQSLYGCDVASPWVPSDTEEVSWKKSYRNFVDEEYYLYYKNFRYIAWFLRMLRKIGQLDDVRIIFWSER